MIAQKNSTSVSGVLRTSSVYTVANARSDATGEMRIEAMIVPSTSAEMPLAASSSRVILKPSK